MTTLYYRLADNVLRAAATGSDVPKLTATLRSTFTFDVACVTAAGLVAPLVAPEAGSVVVKAVIKLAPEDDAILLDATVVSNAADGTARRYTAAWTAEECDSAPFRAAVLGKATVAATLEIEVTHADGTARAITPVTLINAFFQPTDTAPDPSEDASWDWLKLRAPEANGFTHDAALKTLAVDADPAAATHIARTDNPHAVTKDQVGLGSADNTSDANKPVSSAQQAALDLKATLDSPTLTGVPAAPTAAAATNTTQIATTAFVQQELAALLDGAPGALNTLNELAAALGDDANFASTVTTALSGKAASSHTHAIADVTGLQDDLDAKLALAGGTMTGALGIAAGGLLTAALSGSQTWNNIGTVCRGMEFAITDTNSAAGSTLLRLLGGAAGTTVMFEVDKNGNVKVGGNPIAFSNTGGFTSYGAQIVFFDATDFGLFANLTFSGGSSSGLRIKWSDLILGRGAAATLQMGINHASAPTDQVIKAHDVTTGTGAGLTLSGGLGSVANGAVVLNGGNRAAYDASPSTSIIRDILISHGLMASL